MSASALNDITQWRRSVHKCPSCARQLWFLVLGEGKLFWCGVGKCPSIAANNGASSIEELRKNVEEEPEREKNSSEWEWP